MSGLLAAKSLAKTKLKILIIEQDSFLGGILKNSNKISTIANKDNRLWIKEIENKLEGKEKKQSCWGWTFRRCSSLRRPRGHGRLHG